ncbi:MAG: hypothetical protein ACJAW7_002409 [Candidatus Azotimanducaceae bacterium]|jgi:hypothetical protein
MIRELEGIYEALQLAHATLHGLTSSLAKAFDRPELTNGLLEELVSNGKQVGI